MAPWWPQLLHFRTKHGTNQTVSPALVSTNMEAKHLLVVCLSIRLVLKRNITHRISSLPPTLGGGYTNTGIPVHAAIHL